MKAKYKLLDKVEIWDVQCVILGIKENKHFITEQKTYEYLIPYIPLTSQEEEGHGYTRWVSEEKLDKETFNK